MAALMFPARVGMNRPWELAHSPLRNVPRASGDEPCSA